MDFKQWRISIMKAQQIEEILTKIKNVKIAIYGDFCLDAYWILHPKGGEISVLEAAAESVSRQVKSKNSLITSQMEDI